ncbi:MAG: nucleotidyl transferase AbiEii/AbiGii toxin family protein, partial [Sphingomicrobium sp.]
YYDLHAMIDSDAGLRAVNDFALGADCVDHARTFFNRPAFDLASAQPPTFSLTPEGGMYDDLKQDYTAMAAMIFGDPPSFDAIVETVAQVERAINARANAAQ